MSFPAGEAGSAPSHIPLAPEDIAALQGYTTCDVSDALIRLGNARGGFMPGLRQISPAPWAAPSEGLGSGSSSSPGPVSVVGEAYVVVYAPATDPRPKAAGHYIDQVPRGAVLFISAPAPLSPSDLRHSNAVYGGLMSARARVRGVQGVVVDGRVRDVREHWQEGMTVYARDTGTAPPAPALKVVHINDPAHPALFPSIPPSLEGATPAPTPMHEPERERDQLAVHPGDVLVLDMNGVVLLPRALVRPALQLLPGLVAADEQVGRAIREEGMGFVEAAARYRT